MEQVHDHQAEFGDAIEVVARVKPTNAEPVRVVVVIPTFRRPDHLRRTLQSVIDQIAPPAYAIVVTDNDPSGHEGATAAADMLTGADRSSTTIIAKRRGNCAAYNAGFEVALAHYPTATSIQIIDDDELASPHWLTRMVLRAEANGADCVGAPQIPAFEAGADDAMLRHPVFQPPYETAGPVPILYSSGNVLLSTALLREHGAPWLDEAFNFLGGGDSDFFSRVKAKGARFAWEPDAPVTETTPARRSEASWLNARSLRNGSISAAIQRKAASSLADHIERVAKTAALVGLSPYRAFILFLKTGSPTVALDPMNVALGRLLMEFGFANEQYRAAENN